MSSLAPSSHSHSSAPRAARALLALLERLPHGRLTLHTPDGRTLVFGQSGGRPAATLRLSDWGVCTRALSRGDVGFAQDWIDGRWQTDCLPSLLDLLVANRDALDRAVYGSRLGQLYFRLRHWLRRNSKAGSRRNIAAHYDLGNDFYRLWLDPSLSYSSALFGQAGATLEQAQHAKLDRVLEQLRLPAGARVLEVGCGWGGFAEAAARRGLHVTGLTLSVEQLNFARQRLDDAGLGDRTEFRLQDYRDAHGQWDGIASIEMFEAVGERFWPVWFESLHRNLVPGGRAVVQTITIDEALFERYRSGTDFIQQYVFPGGMLPTRALFERMAREHGLAVLDTHAFGQDYARTLALWRETFMARLADVRAQGFDDRFIRLWEFYLAYCEAAFAHGNTDVMQFTLLRT